MALCCINLNSLYPRMLCAKFGWNWPVPVVLEKIFICHLCCFAFSLCIFASWECYPFEESVVLHLKKLYKVLLKLAPWFHRRFKCCQCNFATKKCIISPLEMSVTLHLPSPKDVLSQVWLILYNWRRRWKCEQKPTLKTLIPRIWIIVFMILNLKSLRKWFFFTHQFWRGSMWLPWKQLLCPICKIFTYWMAQHRNYEPKS